MACELAIIGTGPAGLSAGLRAGRYGLDTVLFEREDLGGGLVNQHTIETYPGFPEGISGPDLRSRIVEQLRAYNLELELTEVTALSPGEPNRIETTNGIYRSDAVIVASGGRPKRLTCPGAEEYDGRGIFFCALCDGPLYKEERVAVIGNGEQALMDSVYLAEFASEVLLFLEGAELSASEHVREQVRASANIEVRANIEITAVVGDDVVTGLELCDSDAESMYVENVDGLLVSRGLEPNTEFLPETLSMTDDGKVAVESGLETSIPGVFAAGTVRENSVDEVASAVGDGAVAFRSGQRYLE